MGSHEQGDHTPYPPGIDSGDGRPEIGKVSGEVDRREGRRPGGMDDQGGVVSDQEDLPVVATDPAVEVRVVLVAAVQLGERRNVAQKKGAAARSNPHGGGACVDEWHARGVRQSYGVKTSAARARWS
jgi:hypothetical protein